MKKAVEYLRRASHVEGSLPPTLITILLIALTVYTIAVTPASFGFYHDDGIYVATAKALATGQGYRIISLPGEPLQTKSPPLHPFLLSLVWRAHPDFPENLFPMMILSVLAAVGSLFLTWHYLTRQGYASNWQVILIVSLVALNWRTVILASGIYVEMFYMALSIAGLYLAEEYEKSRTTWIIGTALGVVLGLLFLTRTAGITLLIAVAFYYVLRRQITKAFIPIALGCSFVVGWAAWGYLNRPTAEGVNSAYYESYLQTLTGIIHEAQAETGRSALEVLISIVGKNLLIVLVLTVPLICLGLPFDWPRQFDSHLFIPIVILLLLIFVLILVGFLKQISSGIRLIHIYVVCYLGLHLIWPYSGYDRFLMPLLPFLLYFIMVALQLFSLLVGKEVGASSRLSRTVIVVVIAGAAIGAASLTSYNYGSGIYRALTSLKHKNLERAAEDAEAIRWINENADPLDVLICYRDPMYYLYTGRKATRSSLLQEGGKTEGNRASPGERANTIFTIVRENNARYLIYTSADMELEFQADDYKQEYKKLLDQTSEVFNPVFECSNGRCTIYRIDSLR